MNNQDQEVKEQALVTFPPAINRNRKITKSMQVYSRIDTHKESLSSLENCGVTTVFMADGTIIQIESKSLADKLKTLLVVGLTHEIKKELSTLNNTI